MLASFESLPNELLEIIFQDLTHADLLSLCKTSRSFIFIAQPLLYRSFPATRRSASHLRSFVLQLARRPDLAACVTKLDLVPDQESDIREAEAEVARSRAGHIDFDAGWRRRRGNDEPPKPIPGYLRDETWYEDGWQIIPKLRQFGFDIDAHTGDEGHIASIVWPKPQSKGRLVTIHYHANLLLAITPNLKHLRIDTDWTPAAGADREHYPNTIAHPIIDWDKLRESSLKMLEHLEVVGRPSMTTRRFWGSDVRMSADDVLDIWIEENEPYEFRDVHDYHESMMTEPYNDYQTRTDGDPVNANNIMWIPSLRKLWFTGVQFVRPGSVVLANQLLPITSLHFVDCAMDLEHNDPMRILIEGCAQLRNLEFRAKTNRSHRDDYRYVYMLYNAVKKLWRPCPLHRLIVTIDACLADDDAPYWSFNQWHESVGKLHANHPRETRELTELELDYDMMMDDEFLAKDETWHTRLSECLPRSLEHLTICDYPRDGEDDAREDGDGWPDDRRDLEPLCAPDMLEDLAGDIALTCPKLKTLDVYVSHQCVGPVQWAWSEDVETVEDLERLFEAAGCKLTIHPPTINA